MEHVQYTMTEDLVEEVALRTIPDYVPPKWNARVWYAFFSLLACSVGFGLLLYLMMELEESDELILIVLVGLIVSAIVPVLMALSVVFSWAVSHWVVFCRNVLRSRLKKAYREIMDTTIRWSFHENGFETESIMTRRSVGWTDLKAIRLVPGQRYFAVKDGPELMFPEDALTERIKNLIARKAREHRIVLQEPRTSTKA